LPECEEICDNGVDDNADFLIDCQDSRCFDPVVCVEICGNGLDDDGDFVRDCAEEACFAEPECQPLEVTFDLGDDANPTPVGLPFSEVVANQQAGGQECLAFSLEVGPTPITAVSSSPTCDQAIGEGDVIITLSKDGQEIANVDDTNGSLCPTLSGSIGAGSYVLCIRSYNPIALLPVRLEVRLEPN
jgi:hypothetical protein